VISGATSPNNRSSSAAARYSSSIIIAFIGYFYQYFLRTLSSIVSVFTKIAKIIHETIKIAVGNHPHGLPTTRST